MEKFCSNCGNELIEGVDFCSKCGKNVNAVDTQQAIDVDMPQVNMPQINTKDKKPRKKHGCLFSIVVIVFVIVGAIAIGSMPSNAIQKSLSGVSEESEFITMEEYIKIQLGSSYDEVKAIVGKNGEVTAESSVAGYSTKIITWYGNGTTGSNATVTFLNDKVEGKAQVGLE